VANELKQRGLSLSAAGVRCGWQPHELETTSKRLKALKAKKAPQEGLLLSGRPTAALAKAKTVKEAHGEFETEYPGYCGAQDTFHIGTLKGVGRIYQQTSSTPTRTWRLPSSMIARPRWRPRTCSMTG
jgi:hypothetical protein